MFHNSIITPFLLSVATEMRITPSLYLISIHVPVCEGKGPWSYPIRYAPSRTTSSYFGVIFRRTKSGSTEKHRFFAVSLDRLLPMRKGNLRFIGPGFPLSRYSSTGASLSRSVNFLPSFGSMVNH